MCSSNNYSLFLSRHLEESELMDRPLRGVTIQGKLLTNQQVELLNTS